MAEERERESRRRRKKQQSLCCATPQLSVMYHDCRRPSTHRQCSRRCPQPPTPPLAVVVPGPGATGCNPHMSKMPHFVLWLIPNCNRLNNRPLAGLIAGCSRALFLSICAYACLWFFTHCQAASVAPGQCCLVQSLYNFRYKQRPH